LLRLIEDGGAYVVELRLKAVEAFSQLLTCAGSSLTHLTGGLTYALARARADAIPIRHLISL
jgi:hypothetical protein